MPTNFPDVRGMLSACLLLVLRPEGFWKPFGSTDEVRELMEEMMDTVSRVKRLNYTLTAEARELMGLID